MSKRLTQLRIMIIADSVEVHPVPCLISGHCNMAARVFACMSDYMHLLRCSECFFFVCFNMVTIVLLQYMVAKVF